MQWASIHSLTPLVVTCASKSSFDHTTLSQLKSPGELYRQIAYQSEPETVAVSPFDLLNTTLKSLFLSRIFATRFLKPVQRVFFLSKTKKHYEVNKIVSTSRTDSLGMQLAPKKDINHWNLAAKRFHTVSVFTRAYSQKFSEQKGQCTWPEYLTIFFNLQILNTWKIMITIEEIMKIGLEFLFIDSTFIGIIITVASTRLKEVPSKFSQDRAI